MIKTLNPRLILPLTICVGIAMIGLRANDLWDTVSSGRLFARPAQAQNIEPPKLALPGDASKAGNPTSPDNTKTAGDAKTNAPSSPEITIPDDASPAEMEVLKQLSNRRQELDKRASELDTREELLKIAEQRVDGKIKDMETLRSQLQAMVNQVSETQAAQLDNLVKIYETMKPKDAARIFEALDMPVLLSVVRRMKPTRTASIMAEMAPDKAKEVTTALTKQDKLPAVK